MISGAASRTGPMAREWRAGRLLHRMSCSEVPGVLRKSLNLLLGAGIVALDYLRLRMSAETLGHGARAERGLRTGEFEEPI